MLAQQTQHRRVLSGHGGDRNRQKLQQHLGYVSLRSVVLQSSRMQRSCLSSRQPVSGAVDGFVRRQGLPAPWMRRIHRRSRADTTQLRVVAAT
jgi:hypothetical protein